VLPAELHSPWAVSYISVYLA